MRIPYVNDLNLLSWKKINVFCARFLVDPALQFSNILIQILRDNLYTRDTHTTLPNFITKPAIPVPPEIHRNRMLTGRLDIYGEISKSK